MGKIYYCLVFVFLVCSVRLSAQTYSWSKSYGSTAAAGPLFSEESIRDIAVDASGNSYVIGIQRGTITTLTGTAVGNQDIFIAKLDATGAVVWFQQGIGKAIDDRGLSIAVNSSTGDVYYAGSFTGSNLFFKIAAGGNLYSNGSSTDMYVVKYTSAGALTWVRGIGGTGTDEVEDIEVDASGNIWVAGYVQTNGANIEVYTSGSGRPNLGSFGAYSGSFEAALIKLGSAGTFSTSDAYLFGSAAGAEKFRAMTLDASGNIYLSGELFNTVDFDPSAGTTNVVESSPQGAGDAFIVKYSSAMALQWAGSLKGGGVEFINGLGTDASGNLYAVGSFQSFENFDLFGGTHTKTSVGSSDAFFAQYNGSDGSFNYVQQIGGSSGDNSAQGVYVTSAGDFYMTGFFSGASANFNPGGTALSMSPTGTTDAFLAKYNSSGVNSWAFKAGGAGKSGGYAVNIASDGKIIWGGYYSGSAVDFDPGAGSNTQTSVGSEDMFIAAYNECSGAVITAQPAASQTICTGQNATFSVTATGTGLTYVWKKAGVALSNGGSISGATSATLTITGLVSGDAATYTVDVVGCTGTVTSNNAVLTVPTGASITSQPVATQTLCVGTAASMTVAATGSSLTYQWQKGGVNVTNGGTISGATTATLNISSLVVGDAGNYTVDVTASGCGAPLTSSTSVLNVNTAAAITAQPVTTQTLCAGSSAAFSVTATGAGLTYQWKKGGVNVTDGGTISGATTATLNISSIVSGDAGNYTVVVTGTCGSPVTSSTSALIVNTGVAITAQPAASQTLCTGNAAAFSVTATGSGLTYQWQKGGVNVSNGGTISGATTTSLAISSLVSGDAGNYTVIVTGTCGTPVTSSTSVLTVNSGAAITAQPAATQTICAGSSASMTVTATGSSLTYQWKKGGVNVTNGGTVSGATTATLNISSLVAGDAGNYTVDVTASGCGSAVTSSTSVLNVNAAPSITAQPAASQTLCTGNAAAFSVTATGSGLTYQWQKGGVNVSNGGTISGATTSSLAISSLVSGDAGNYTVIVTGTCGTPVTSSASVLTVNSGAAITAQPAATQTICAGSAASMTVTATGSSLTYQWKKGGVNVTNGGTVSGATTATLNISSLVAGDAGNYTVDVTASGCGSAVTSSTSVLNVNTAPSITAQPAASQTLCTGNAAAFSVTATGSGLTYQWQKGGVNVSNGGTISGATTSSLAISSLVSGDAGNYTVIVTGTCGTPVTSSTSVLTVNSGAAITAQPAATQTICVGSAASMTVTATGSSLTYQWKKGGVNVTNGGTVSGATTATLNISSLVAGDAGNYTLDVTASGCGSPVTSSTSVLNVNTAPSITAQPAASQTLCTGNAAAFSVTATGSGLTYQWQKGGVNVTNGGTISGATTTSLAISSLVSGDAGNYTVIVTGTCGTPVTSSTSVLTVNSGAAITAQPAATQTICAGSAASMTVTATGSGLTYQWKKGGVNVTNGGTVSGATTATLNISSLVAGDAGNYTVDVTASGCGSAVTSSTSVLNVNTAPSITAQPAASQTLCTGNAAAFSVTATGSGLTYQWQKGGVNVTNGGTISGATTTSLAISSLVSGDAGNYTVIVTGTCGTPVTSSTSVLTVNSGASISSQPIAVQTLCVGDLAVFSVTASGTALTYQWQKNGVNVSNGGGTLGATTATLSISSVIAANAGDYTVNVTASGCGTPVTSSISQLIVNSPINITTQPPAAQTLCTGNGATISATVTGSNLNFQWQKNGVDITDGGTISGAATSTLTISSLVLGDAGNYTLNITGVCGSPVTSSTSVLNVNTGPAITSQPVASQTLCTGTAASFNVTATGSGLTYQWQKNGVNISNGGTISGATTNSLNISSLAAADAGNYTVNVTASGCGAPLMSSTSVLTVNNSIVVTTQPADSQTLCTGNAASFTISATGTGITYQWQLNGVDLVDGGTISGASTSSLAISSLVSGDAGTYTVNMTGACAPVTSSSSVLTVNTGAAITAQPVASQTLCAGAAASFAVTATGSSLTYQWQLNGVNVVDGGTISGATTSTLSISSVAAGDAGNYTVNVSASGCGVPLTSSTSSLTVNTPVNITTQPTANQTLCTGNAASFTVAATGTGLTYQWQLNGVDVVDGGTISGATTSLLAISSLVSGDAGNYTVIVTGVCGSPVTSSTSALVVNTGAAITSQPVASQTLCAGAAASFAVTATGSSLTYQWQLNGVDVVDGGTISGATTSTLSISSVAAGDAGNYTVNVSASGCGVPLTSSTSSLTVNTPVNITTQPTANQTLCTGNAASFTVAATGTGLTYQWQLNGVDVVDGGTISGATTNSLAISSLVSGDAGNYTVIVTGVCGSPVTSSTSALVVNTGAAITSQPVASQTLCAGAAASFAVTATGSSLTYQWQLNGVDVVDGGTISGATTSTLSISSVAAGDAGNYTVNVSASGCGVPLTSSTSSLTVNTPVNITAQPTANQALCTGNAASFTVTATGTGLTYQWQLNGVYVVDGGTISGATTSSLAISSLVSGDAGNYTVIVTGVCGSPVTSSTSALVVNTGAAITSQPVASQTLCAGAAASFAVTATGSSLTYQWQLNGVDVVDGGTISGATTSTLAISSVAAGDAGNYTVNVSASGCGVPLTSSTSSLTVNTPVNITAQPTANQTLCTGNAASFTVTATGTGLTYQWQLNGVDVVDGGTISGATTSSLAISSLVSGDAGNYTVIVTGVCGSPVTSSTSALVVNTGAAITSQPVASQTVCTGSPASFSVTATGSSLTYQWKLGGVNLVDGGTVSGATTSTLNISSVAAGDAGNFTVDISAAGCGAPLTSSVSALVVNNSIVINNQPVANQNLCSGSTATFTAVVSGSGLTYQWQKGGVDITDGGTVSGATTSTLTISSVTVADGGNYTLNITGTCGTATSTVSALSVTASVSITMQPSDVNACLGQATNFDLTATGPSLTYQWKKNGVNVVDGGSISGATTSSLVFSPVAASDADIYTCVISSSCGAPVTSNTVTLTVGTGVTITKQPISSVICLTQAASFNIQAPGATSYQWQFKPAGGSYANLANGANVSGVTTTTLIINSAQFADRGNYRCLVTGGSCSGGVFSAAASLSFQSPSIASQPLSQSVCAGQTVSFGVVALGNNLTYQWVKGGVNMTNGGRITGAQSATLKITNADLTDVASYYCQVTGLCPPPTFSDVVDLTLTICTAIDDPIDATLFNIYPNPSTGIYHLDMDMYASGTLTYEVFNTLGESITSDEIQGEGKVVSVIDLSDQAAGVYIIKLNYDDKHSWIRLVLEK